MPYTLEWLLEATQRRGLLTDQQRTQVEIDAPRQRARVLRAHAESYGGLTAYKVSAAELLASMELRTPAGEQLDEERLAMLLAEEANLPYRKIDSLQLDMDLITKTVSRPFALRHVTVPVGIEQGQLVVAVEDPFDLELVENLRSIGANVTRVVSSKRDIMKVITDVYGFRQSVESAARQREMRADTLNDFEQLVRVRSVGELQETDQHIVNAVDLLLRYAFDQRASDIHIEPRREETQVRLRIDGVLHLTHRIPRAVHNALTARIKAMARMDIAEKRRPQDGRIKTVVGDKEIELRVSTLCTAFGEKTVIRIFDPEVLLRELGDLGFDPTDHATFADWISRPHGMLLITGPTGSGKTTTLYTALQQLARDDVNVTTVEDPIEMVTDRFNQVAVQPKIGVGFAQALRSILRQDPDIIMVGEIRDPDTAEMAAQAALTGHLVLSTLHTNDSVSAVTRLVDLQLPRFLVCSTVVGVMAQRLLRRICTDCKVPAPLTPEQALSLGLEPGDARYAGTARGEGCKSCRGTGYRGRVGAFELLPVDGELADRVVAETPESELRAFARARGMRTILGCALARLAEGTTTPEEVLRIAGPAA